MDVFLSSLSRRENTRRNTKRDKKVESDTLLVSQSGEEEVRNLFFLHSYAEIAACYKRKYAAFY